MRLHLRTDVFTSVGVMASLALIWAGHRFFPDPNIHWLDPAAALGVAVLIMHAAYRLTVRSARDLMDVQLPPEEEIWIRDLIRAQRPVIHGFHKLRTRKAGNFRFIEFHIKVDPEMSVGGLAPHYGRAYVRHQKTLPPCQRHHPYRALRRPVR